MTPEERKARLAEIRRKRKAVLDKAAEGKHKRCIKCREKKPLIEFTIAGQYGDRQEYCKVCKTAITRERRHRDPRAKLRHIFAVRVRSQLGDLCPEGIDGSIEKVLGYPMQRATRWLQRDLDRNHNGITLKDCLEGGWHIDHIKPLVAHEIVKDGEVDWDVFKEAWHFSNLQMLTAKDNLKKGGKWDG